MEFDNLKAAILAGEITVNTDYLPSNHKIFSIMFYHKELTEPTIRAVVGEKVNIQDKLWVEHRNDILKAIESSVWFDVYTKDEIDCIFTLDMQREYFKKRLRNRNVYYGAKEIASQVIKNGKYEHLKQVSIIFILEENTTPNTPAISKLQFTDVNTKKPYTDILTLYEVNLNRITDKTKVNPDIHTLKAFLSIKDHKDLCAYVDSCNTSFSKQLLERYIGAITDDALLLKIEGSNKIMNKTTEWALMDAEIKGREEGQIVSLIKQIQRKMLKSKTREQIIDELEMDEQGINILDNLDSYTHLLPS